jgi:hypothetical protein
MLYGQGESEARRNRSTKRWLPITNEVGKVSSILLSFHTYPTGTRVENF